MMLANALRVLPTAAMCRQAFAASDACTAPIDAPCTLPIGLPVPPSCDPDRGAATVRGERQRERDVLGSESLASARARIGRMRAIAL